MAKTIQLTADEAAENDALSLDEKALTQTAEMLSAGVYNKHREYLERRQKFWRGLFTKYNLDPNSNYDVQSGPGGGVIVQEDMLPGQPQRKEIAQ